MARTYVSSVRAEQAATTRDRILNSAETLFVERGVQAATLDDIARLAGVSKPTVFAAVGSKSALLAALAERAEETERAPLAAAAERAGAAKPGKAVALVAAYLADRHDRRGGLDAVLADDPGTRLLAESAWDAAASTLAAALGHRALGAALGALGSSAVFRQVRRSWSLERYQQWLQDTLSDQLARDGKGKKPKHHDG